MNRKTFPYWLRGAVILGALSLFVGDTSFLIGSIVLGAFIGWLCSRLVDSSVWNRTPYWLRGGMIGGGVALLSVFLTNLCDYLIVTQGLGFECLPFSIPLIPLTPLWEIDYLTPLSGNFFEIIAVIIWFILGSILGAIVRILKRAH